MDKEMIYNAIVKVDDDLIDRSLTRKPNKKTKATIILSGSCIAIAACFVLPWEDNASKTQNITFSNHLRPNPLPF